jgi:tellurium resistance protein TerD
MAVSLSKGANVSLKKAATESGISESAAAAISNVTLGLGWKPRSTDGQAYDLDAYAIAVGADGKVLSDNHFVFFGNLKSPEGALEHTGDNLTGEGEGDDEQINADLAALKQAGASSIVFAVAIYEADKRGNQTFGQVGDAFIRVVDKASGTELARYDLSEDASTATTVLFGELYDNNGDWKFRAKGDGYAAGLAGLAKEYGVNV